MDHVIVQIGDGSNWYTILNWGDGIPGYEHQHCHSIGHTPESYGLFRRTG
jgi:hypothetical protein